MTWWAVDDSDGISEAIEKLKIRLSEGAECVTRRMLVGGYPEKKLWWHRKEGLWAFVDRLDNRYWCAYGTNIGKPEDKLPISVEINPPIHGPNLRLEGCA